MISTAVRNDITVVSLNRPAVSHTDGQAYAHAQRRPRAHVKTGSPTKADGDPWAYEPHEIATTCDWHGDHPHEDRGQDLIDGLVEAGFLERTKGRMVVSEWAKHLRGSDHAGR